LNAAARPTVLVVAAALVDPSVRMLLARRPAGKAMAGLWEFPGGKIEAGESPEAALARELHEELSIDVATADLEPLTFASHAYETFHLLMPVFTCRRWSGTVRPREGQEIAWAAAAELARFAMPPADAPLVPVVRTYLARSAPAA
jgi:8-oxo-dGTP diphosphatase